MKKLKCVIYTDLGEQAKNAFCQAGPVDKVEFTVEDASVAARKYVGTAVKHRSERGKMVSSEVITNEIRIMISSDPALLRWAGESGFRIIAVGAENIPEDPAVAVCVWPLEETDAVRKIHLEQYLRNMQEEVDIFVKIYEMEYFENGGREVGIRDSLTGLYNREYLSRYFRESFEQLWTLLYLDLDGFKFVNDLYSHSKGDEILKQTAALLRRFFPNARHVRVGGDQFILLLEEQVDEEFLEERLHRLEKEVELLIPERPGLLSISCGVIRNNGGPLDTDRLFREIDMKMYELKRKARERRAGGTEPEYESEDARRVLGVFRRAFIGLDEVPRKKRGGQPANVEKQLMEIAEYLRIGRISVIYYDNQEREHFGEGTGGEIYNCGSYDEKRFIEHRRVTGGFNVVYYRAEIREGEPDWTDRERERVDLLLRIIYVFNGRERLTDIVERLYFYDSETELHNLKYYMNVIGRLSQERKLGSFSAMRIDMKHFSGVNQQLGRQLGNLVLKRYVQGVSEALSGDEMICRVGGDNFVLLVDRDHEDDILDLLEETMIVYNDASGDRVRVGASVGVYQIPDDGRFHLPGEIMDRISRACQRAKHSKDSSVAYYDVRMVEDIERGIQVEAAFQHAIEAEEFQVFYQPKVDMETYQLIGAEALCRWFHNGKMIQPGDFIPHLERSMAICALDMYMLDHVCRDIRKWLDEGKKAVRVSVNLSRRNLADVDLLTHIFEIIDRNRVPHEYVEVELTETTSDAHFVDLRKIVEGLQEKGVVTAVDDFGIGYSSLTLIRDLPWDVLKIDRSFLPMEGDPEAKKKEVMFRSVVSMAQGLGMECIVEGVETKAQWDLMLENHCDHAQGFFFDRPMPKEEFERRMEGTDYRAKVEAADKRS